MSPGNSKARIALLIDVKNWAFDTLAKGISSTLSSKYSFEIITTIDNPSIDFSSFDIIHNFGVRSSYYRKFNHKHCKIIKSLYNTISRDNDESMDTFYEKYLNDIDALTVPTLSMYSEMQAVGLPLFLTPEGIDCKKFAPKYTERNECKIGWAGNTSKAYKNFSMAYAACQDIAEIHIADGSLRENQMIQFYNEMDIILCTSDYGEGCPRSLLEGMACGCFAISFPVGIAPEEIQHERNGLLVSEQTVESLQKSIRWSQEHLQDIRNNRAQNAELIRGHRSWAQVAPSVDSLYQFLLNNG